MGGLGPDRTFGVCRDDGEIKLPSDLAGVTLARYDAGFAERDLDSAIDPAAMQIRKAIREHGCLPRATRTPEEKLASTYEEIRILIEDIESETQNMYRSSVPEWRTIAQVYIGECSRRQRIALEYLNDAGHDFPGPHLPATVLQQLPEALKEIESATTEFLRAVDDLILDFSRPNAERVWTSSRVAWSLMFPFRRSVLRTAPSLVEAFRDAVRRVRDALSTEARAEGEFFEYLQGDLSRRESLIDALLSENSDTRIRELLAAERQAVDRG